MKPKSLSRTLGLRPIVFSKDHNKHLAELILEAHRSCLSIGMRMQHDYFTAEDSEPETVQSYFYNNLIHYANGAVYFELWSFAPGRMPAGYTPDLHAANATYDIAEILDAHGNKKELIHISHVLVFKNVAVVEATKGTGGTYLIEKYINKLLRQYCQCRPPRIAFTTAMSSDLQKEIDQGGGAVAVSLGITSAIRDTNNQIAGLLSEAHEKFGSTDLVSLSWRAEKNNTLNTAEVITEARNAHDDSFDQIYIKLRHGSIRGLKRFKITHPISVRDIGGKNPDHRDIRDAMIDYLGMLLTPDHNGNRVIDDDGNLIKT